MSKKNRKVICKKHFQNTKRIFTENRKYFIPLILNIKVYSQPFAMKKSQRAISLAYRRSTEGGLTIESIITEAMEKLSGGVSVGSDKRNTKLDCI